MLSDPDSADALASLSSSAEPTVLSSPNAPIARSLLLAHAVRRALAGEWVLFVCASPAPLEQSPFARPPSVRGDLQPGGPVAEALARVQFKYISTGAMLRQFLAGAHNMSRAPDLVIIDDLLAFTHDGSHGSTDPAADREAAERLQRTLALAINLAEYCACARGADLGRSCGLLVSVTERALPPLATADTVARKQWFKRRLRVDSASAGRSPVASHLCEYTLADSLGQELARMRLRAADGSNDAAELELADVRLSAATAGDGT